MQINKSDPYSFDEVSVYPNKMANKGNVNRSPRNYHRAEQEPQTKRQVQAFHHSQLLANPHY